MAVVIAEGGCQAGELVLVDIVGAGRLTFDYTADPEGNQLELQKWE